MLPRLVIWRRPRVFPGLTEAESEVVWDRANGYALAVDEESALTEDERDEIHAVLEAQPPLSLGAKLYLTSVIRAADRPLFFAAAAILVPSTILHLLHVAISRLLGI